MLLVEDDLAQLELVSELLAKANAAVTTATSADEAVQRLAQCNPDVIVSDIDMPGCDGYHFLRMVRSRTREQGGATPAIALTGKATTEDQTRALLAGYQVHLAKPFPIIALLAAIHGVMERQAERQAPPSSAPPRETSSRSGRSFAPRRSGGTMTDGDNNAKSPAARPEHPGSERDRDEQRSDAGPQYGGEPWRAADRRGDDRFGHARNDDADPFELAPGEAENDDDDAPSAADPELAAAEAAGEIESGGQREGMGRGEKPRKPKSQEK